MADERRRHRGLWVLATLPLGFTTWAAFAYAGVRAQYTRWKLYAVLYGVAEAVGVVLASAEEDSTEYEIAGALIVGVWIVGFAHALIVRPAYLRRVQTIAGPLSAARDRIERREEALRIAREEPELAAELGIGRPDRRGAMDAGLVDVNSAPEGVLERLPGVDRALAERIVTLREQLDGFSSVEDLGMTLDLSADEVEDLREKVVFLPR